MNISIIIKKLKLILSEKKLNQQGKSTGFTQRKRNVTVFQLVTAMICALGDKNTDCLSDILRVFNHLTKQSVKYKPFHNQLAKPALAELMKEVTERVFSHWISWWYDILEAIVQQRRKAQVNKVTNACEFLKENAQRAHPNRDKLMGILQFGLEPAFYEDSSNKS